jgi:hypothetical protein
MCPCVQDVHAYNVVISVIIQEAVRFYFLKLYMKWVLPAAAPMQPAVLTPMHA